MKKSSQSNPLGNLSLNLDDLVSQISKKFGYPMAQVKNTVREYLEMVIQRTQWKRQNPDPIQFGILPLDLEIELNPGITVICGHESIGKTSVAKRIAIAAHKSGFNVIYWDAENKLFLHDLRYMEGITLANSRRIGGLKSILRCTGVDVVIVDTVTSMEERTSLIRQMVEFTPYLILTTQMRNTWHSPEPVPAVYETTLSTSHTRLRLSHREKIVIEGVDMIRVQYHIDKYEADKSKVGEKGSFVIRDGIVDNVYTAYDYLKARGRISSLGFSKALDGNDLGGRFREVCNKPEIANLIIGEMWKYASGDEIDDVELYIDEHLRDVQVEKPERGRSGTA